jgi:hypothetical protein
MKVVSLSTVQCFSADDIFSFSGPMDGVQVDDSASAVAAGEDVSAYAQRVQVFHKT